MERKAIPVAMTFLVLARVQLVGMIAPQMSFGYLAVLTVLVRYSNTNLFLSKTSILERNFSPQRSV